VSTLSYSLHSLETATLVSENKCRLYNPAAPAVTAHRPPQQMHSPKREKRVKYGRKTSDFKFV